MQLVRKDESDRLAAVRRYDILDTPADGTFDRIAALAAELFDVPIAIISIVDHDRIWFKSHHGLDVPQVGREPGLCSSAILHDAPWVLPDARTDPRSMTNSLVAGEFGLRFYVGVPLKTSDGFNLGTLCVIDKEARTVDDRQIARLEMLAGLVIDQMELRLSARRAIAEMSLAIEQKDEALGRARMLAKEIDHRVMNSLQLTSGMLAVQSRALGDSDAGAQLSLAASRVTAIAQAHRHIYDAETVGMASACEYIQRLCDDLSEMIGDKTIRVDCMDGDLPTERLAPIGLIVSELVLNAVKHGASGIAVTLTRRDPPDYTLTVTDNGPGLPDGFSMGATSGLGMKIIDSLVRQLDGKLETGPSAQGGAGFTLSFAGN